MNISLCLVVILSILVTTVRGKNEKDTTILLDITKNLSPNTLKYMIKHGEYVQRRLAASPVGVNDIKKRSALSFLDNISLQLYKYSVNKLRTSTSINRSSSKKIICFPRGCINIDDVGIHP